MLYLIAQWLEFEGVLNLVRYQTFRFGATLMTALIIGLIIGPRFINMLRVRHGKGQPIREDGPQSHLAKRGTPTMGGLMILISLVIALLLWMDLSSPFVWACLAVTIGFGVIGFMDDYDKVSKASHRGVPGRVRLLLEFIVAGIAAYIIVSQINTNLYIPLFSGSSDPAWTVLLCVCCFRNCWRGQRGEPDRRAGRIGDHAGGDRRGHIRIDLLSGWPGSIFLNILESRMCQEPVNSRCFALRSWGPDWPSCG